MRGRLILLCMLCVLTLRGETAATQIFSPSVRSVKLHPEGEPLLPPLMSLRSGKLVLSFDEMSDTPRDFSLRLVHCNADWKPSDLIPSEYASSVNEELIEDYSHSSAGFNGYFNYRAELPSDVLKALVSGNYLVQVFDTFNPDDVVLQARFSVVEDGAVLEASVSALTDKGNNNGYQQVGAEATLLINENIDPHSELILTIEQNDDPQSSREIRGATRVSGNRIGFSDHRDMIFDAGDEYLRFETVRTDYPGMGVDSIRFREGQYHAYLRVAEPRMGEAYRFDRTQQGAWLPRAFNATDGNLAADYIDVHFTLATGMPLHADVEIEGEFARPLPKKARRAVFSNGAYRVTVPLKQGAYNYKFVATDAAGKRCDIIDGNKSATQNAYTLRLFLRRPGSRGDRLLAAKRIIYDK